MLMKRYGEDTVLKLCLLRCQKLQNLLNTYKAIHGLSRLWPHVVGWTKPSVVWMHTPMPQILIVTYPQQRNFIQLPNRTTSLVQLGGHFRWKTRYVVRDKQIYQFIEIDTEGINSSCF